MTFITKEMNEVLTDITKTQKPIRSIVLTPTWVAAARIYLECVKHGDNPKTKADAEKEIMRMAHLLDAFILERESKSCADNISPCERRTNSSDNTCEHYPN